jgi:type II secretory ATPase GspE/PulE/Tfp pilus assembly ATPase PilB-like protein
VPLVEHAGRSAALRTSVLARHDEAALAAAGLRPLAARAIELVAQGVTSLAEVERVLGPVA